MLNPIHTRKSPLYKSPFASMEDVDEYVDHVSEIVKDAIGHEPEVSVSLTYPDRAFPMMSRQEFQEAKGELPLQDVTTLDVTISDKQDSDFGVGLLLTAESGRVGVQGRSVTRVDGVDVQVRKELDRLREAREDEARRRQGERVEAASHLAAGVLPALPVAPIAAEAMRLLTLRAPRSRRDSAAPLPAGANRWRRVANNPWTITIVGGAVAAAIAVGLVALVILLATSVWPGNSPGDQQSSAAQTRSTGDLP